MWPCPEIILSVFNNVIIPNLTLEPLTVKRHEHFCQFRTVMTSDSVNLDFSKPSILIMPSKAPTVKNSVPYCSTVQIDPHDILPVKDRQAFRDTLSEFDVVFSPSLPGYNCKVGLFQALMNKGLVLAYNAEEAFADVDRYTKLQPSLISIVDSILCHIAK